MSNIRIVTKLVNQYFNINSYKEGSDSALVYISQETTQFNLNPLQALTSKYSL